VGFPQETDVAKRIVTRTERIYWGDCDPAGIIYFPRYFDIFDRTTTAMFEQALGMTKYQFLRAYKFHGYPMVDIRAKFLRTTTFGDDVVIETTVPNFKRSSFQISHRLLKQGEVAVECTETRVWVTKDPNDPENIKASAVPPEVIARFAQLGN
jgi:4-hydroxybenzoyl-CoA thioesterase